MGFQAGYAKERARMCEVARSEGKNSCLDHIHEQQKSNYSTLEYFCAALLSGDLPMMQMLVGEGYDVNAILTHGQAGIHKSMFSHCKLDVLTCLRNLKADLELVVPESLETPLHLACKYGSYEKVVFLCEAGVEVDPLDPFRRSPLHHAITYSQSLDIVRFLIETKGADYLGALAGDDMARPESSFFIALVSAGNYTDMHAWRTTCIGPNKPSSGSDLQLIQYLIERGAGVHDDPEQESQMLSQICSHSTLEVLQYFAPYCSLAAVRRTVRVLQQDGITPKDEGCVVWLLTFLANTRSTRKQAGGKGKKKGRRGQSEEEKAVQKKVKSAKLARRHELQNRQQATRPLPARARAPGQLRIRKPLLLPETGRKEQLRHDLPQGGQLRHDLPQGGQLRHDLPQGGQLRHDLPQGGQLRHDLPQGGQLRHDLPQEQVREKEPVGENYTTPLSSDNDDEEIKVANKMLTSNGEGESEGESEGTSTTYVGTAAACALKQRFELLRAQGASTKEAMCMAKEDEEYCGSKLEEEEEEELSLQRDDTHEEEEELSLQRDDTHEEEEALSLQSDDTHEEE
jgi:hypothetical protein